MPHPICIRPTYRRAKRYGIPWGSTDFIAGFKNREWGERLTGVWLTPYKNKKPGKALSREERIRNVLWPWPGSSFGAHASLTGCVNNA